MPAVPDLKLVDTHKFDRYLLQLKAQMGPGVTWKRLIKNEAASILAKAAERTKRAKLGDINKKYTIKNRTTKNLPEGARKRKKDSRGKYVKQGQVKGSKTPQNEKLTPFITLRKGGKKYYTKNYYPDKVYDQLKDRMKFFKERAKNRAFSGKATWFLIAKKAGVSTRKFKAVARLQRAISAQAGSFQSDQVENGTPKKKVFGFSIRVDNMARCCLNRSARGSNALRSAMNGRVSFMRRNMRQGVFEKASAVATKYPGVIVGTTD